jgi:transcriptional regulator with XRE-family HTH domain
LNANSLEKAAGVKRSAVRNIIQGYSKKPSADLLQQIASVLDCTVNDLLGESLENYAASTPIPRPKTRVHTDWNETLYLEAVKTICKLLPEAKFKPSLEQVNGLVLEAYQYAISNKLNDIDQNFSKWLIGKSG